ncbi:MAG TPA: protein translocase subunit SecD, partial [Pseudobdellovibrionaceae bacterium]|nr:protein translocase subunit SecD [Pseudobdellovibrionaceae bacterium]
MNNLKLRTLLAGFGIALTVVWVFPNLVDVSHWPWYPSKAKLNYGLDIQGGLHLVMGADVDGVVTESTTRLIASLREELPKAGANLRDIKMVDGTRGEITIETDAATKDAVSKFLSDRYSTTLQNVDSTNDSITVRYFDSYIVDYKDRVIQQSIETIRNRIDEFGVSEPSIARQGTNRILIQLPGMADAERAKALINATAKLDFMIVSQALDQQALAKLVEDAEKAGNYSMTTMKYSDYVTKLNQDL